MKHKIIFKLIICTLQSAILSSLWEGLGYAQNNMGNSFAWNTKLIEEREKEKKSKEEFTRIDKSDMDKDGVPDMDDFCQGTPKSVKVDRKGCPIDSDHDWVPDYLDKEPDTPMGTLVDENGRTLTGVMLFVKARNYSSAEERKKIFMADPSLTSLKIIDAEIWQKKLSDMGMAIPANFQDADTNKDGVISSFEVTAIVDGYISGTNRYSAEKIHRLIDYFFEQ